MCSIASNVSQKDGSVREELPELAVGDEKGSEGAQTVKCLIAMLLGSVLVDGGARESGASTGDLLRLPDEVLKEVALVLGEEQDLGLLDDGLEVAYQLLALGRQLL